ncbi:MAG: hypothetical protein ACP5HC_08395 [Caldisericum sp.]
MEQGMNSSISQEVSLEQRIENLKNQLQEGNLDLKSFEQVYQRLQELQREFLRLLEWAIEDQRGKKYEEEFKTLYQKIAGWKVSELIEKLKEEGLRLRKSDLKKAFDQQGYRILELVRAGKRDAVFYTILRIFVSAREKFPPELVEVFKPVYSDELFKIFLFSFLSSVLIDEEEETNKKKT